jgi:hypothetical protein
MKTFTNRKSVRIVCTLIMVALMFSFVNNMAHTYYDSLRCIAGMEQTCETQPETTVANTTNVASADGSDEWLCSLGETSACASTTAAKVEVASLQNK